MPPAFPGTGCQVATGKFWQHIVGARGTRCVGLSGTTQRQCLPEIHFAAFHASALLSLFHGGQMTVPAKGYSPCSSLDLS